MGDRGRRGAGFSRRAWLAGFAASWLAAAAHGDDPKEQGEGQRDLDEVQAQARKVGLGKLLVNQTEHYQGVGDAPEPFRKEALKLCEGLYDDYLKHFKTLGFAIREPAARQTVVILADAQRFAAFLEEDLGAAVAGIFDRDTNRLVIFDNRAGGGPNAQRANTVSLFHEATHQLTFNTGLLDRTADAPLTIIEGLGMYGETRRPSGRPGIGGINRERLPVLAEALQDQGLFPLEQLLDDDVFDNEKTEQLAYAQSWLLVHGLLHARKNRLDGFRDYLKAIRKRRDPGHRLDDARQYLGDLGRLDQELRTLAFQILERSRV